jgi:TonB family protein
MTPLHRSLFLTISAVATTLAVALCATPKARAQEVSSQLQQIIRANSLDVAGKSPFHLKVSFQVYTLDGKPSDTGTVEEWWAAPGASRTTITAASLKSTDPLPFDGALGMDPREKYLIQRLLDAELHPLAEGIAGNTKEIKAVNRDFDKVTLSCITLAKNDPAGSGRPPESFCVDPKDDALRIQFEPGASTTVRNGVATFSGTYVSLNLQIAFGSHPAITGKVTTLQVFDPASAAVTLPKPGPPPEDGGNGRGGVVVGRVLHKSPPLYPEMAKENHVSGSVLLHAVISKQGSVKDMFVIASSSPMLTQAAMDAVRDWTYSPYLLNGQPTEVDTVVQVNFNFGKSY